MATVGQLIYSNDNSSKSLYDSTGARIQLAPLCLTITDEVVAVDGSGNPSILVKKVSTNSSGGSGGGAGTTQIVAGTTFASSVSFTRPADTSAYAVLDTVSNSTSSPAILNFTNLARVVGGSGYITKARITVGGNAVTARFRLHLYRQTVSSINDNAPFTLLLANEDKRIGTLDFVACTTEGTGSNCSRSQNLDIRLAYSQTLDANIYGILETLDVFTPTSGQTFYIELTAEQN